MAQPRSYLKRFNTCAAASQIARFAERKVHDQCREVARYRTGVQSNFARNSEPLNRRNSGEGNNADVTIIKTKRGFVLAALTSLAVMKKLASVPRTPFTSTLSRIPALAALKIIAAPIALNRPNGPAVADILPLYRVDRSVFHDFIFHGIAKSRTAFSFR
jgi:hypothetical protein